MCGFLEGQNSVRKEGGLYFSISTVHQKSIPIKMFVLSLQLGAGRWRKLSHTTGEMKAGEREELTTSLKQSYSFQAKTTLLKMV